MDCFQVTESLDSLWFFSNVFFSASISQTLSPTTISENTTPKQVKEPVIEEISEPISGNLKNRPNQSPLCVQKPVRVELEMLDSAESPSPMSTNKGEKRIRGSRSKKRGLECRRKILGGIGLCFDEKEISEPDHACVDSGNFWCIYLKYEGLYDHYKNMPPFDDNMAMKEHLKSWAFAVACSVR